MKLTKTQVSQLLTRYFNTWWLPGVVYLEMARAAVLAAGGRKTGSAPRILFTDIAWIQPIYIDQAREVHCRLGRSAARWRDREQS